MKYVKIRHVAGSDNKQQEKSKLQFEKTFKNFEKSC